MSNHSHPAATMPEDHQHESLIKTPKQLAIVVALAFLVPITVIGLLSQLVTSGVSDVKEDAAARKLRLMPVGTVDVADPNAPRVVLSGEQVFVQVCKTCHEAGLAGAPKMGDATAWKPRIAEGEATLFKHALGGYTGKTGSMPAKGGNPDLADDDVERAVVYIANQSGAHFKEPPTPVNAVAVTPAAAGLASSAPAPAAAAPVAAVAMAPAAAAATPAAAAPADGKATYESTCHVCHGTGLAGSPKFGDKAAWAPR
ncbi:MAG: c-type cytochrome, partial [Casimicrobiaceae bacterium]